jgi:hypothetical protein
VTASHQSYAVSRVNLGGACLEYRSMFDATWYPLGARPWHVLAVFCVALLLMHAVLVYWLKLGKVAWKRADYFWLGATILSLIGAAAEVRRNIAADDLKTRAERRDWAWHHVVDEARFMTGPAVCSPFVKTEWSPANFDEIQRQYRLVCKASGALLAALPLETPDQLPPILRTQRPPISDTILLSFYSDVDEAGRMFLREQSQYNQTRDAAERSEWDSTLVVVSPILLALALALRITKVTGEIRIEKLAAATALPLENSETDEVRAASETSDN